MKIHYLANRHVITTAEASATQPALFFSTDSPAGAFGAVSDYAQLKTSGGAVSPSPITLMALSCVLLTSGKVPRVGWKIELVALTDDNQLVGLGDGVQDPARRVTFRGWQPLLNAFGSLFQSTLTATDIIVTTAVYGVEYGFES